MMGRSKTSGFSTASPKRWLFICQKNPRLGTYREKKTNPKATKQLSAHISPALPCCVGRAQWLSACRSCLPRPCLCLPISHAFAESMKDDGVGPPEQKSGWITHAGEREAQWGLGGYRWRRRNKRSCWFITETGAFCSPASPRCAPCLLSKDGYDVLVTSSSPVSLDTGCPGGPCVGLSSARQGTCWLLCPQDPGVSPDTGTLLPVLSDGWRSGWHSFGPVLVPSQTFPTCGSGASASE